MRVFLSNPGPPDIQRLVGCHWRLWKFSPSHDHLAAEIHGYDNGTVYLSFLLCERVEVPTFAKLQEPQVDVHEDNGLTFSDLPNGIRIHCREVVLHSDLPEHWDQ